MVWFSKYILQVQASHPFDYLLFIFTPLASISAFLWFGFPFMALFCSSFLLLTLPSWHIENIHQDATHTNSQYNLKVVKQGLESYKIVHGHYPIPTISGATNSSLKKQHSLEAILSNQHKFGDGQIYLNTIPNDLLSGVGDNNFVCIVHDFTTYTSDLSDYKNCESKYIQDIPKYSERGYVYLPQEGLIRLNGPY